MMLKLFSCVLSLVMVFTSVTPSLAQVAQTRRAPNFDTALQRIVQEKMADSFWVSYGEDLFVKECSTLSCLYDTLVKAQLAAPKKDILQAVVCDKDGVNCVPALAYAWGGIHHAVVNDLEYQGKIIVETAPLLATLITEYGLHGEPDRHAVRNYFYKIIQEAGHDCDSGFLSTALGKREFETGSQKNRADARHANSG